MLSPLSSRPRASLARVVEDLGDTFLEVVAGRVEGADDLGGVVIYDPADDLVLPERAVVLGVGVHEPEQIGDLLFRLGRHHVAALVVRAPIAEVSELRRTAVSSGVVLLALTKGASWSQLAAMLRTLLSEADVGDDVPTTLGGMPSGDLFSLANAIAALLDAPVTIEDRAFNVLAFSGRQDEADASRVETILGRQVPDRLARALERSGVIGDLYQSTREVYLKPDMTEYDEIAMLRVAVAVRAGDEVLGSIWAAVPEPLNAERTRAFLDSAKLVALHLLRMRAGADVERRLRADLVATALEGGTRAPEALGRLGLLGQPMTVVALGLLPSKETHADPDGQSRAAAERQRLADALAVHLSAVAPRAAVALLGDVAYGLLPIPADVDDSNERARRLIANFLERTGSRAPVVIGIGPLAPDAARLSRSRTGADRALRVLMTRAEPGAMATLADVHVSALMLDLGDMTMARDDEITGHLALLQAYDAQHNGSLVETLECWLDAFGDVAAAAAAAFVHTNTFRYRLKRLEQISGIDLDSPEDRFAAMLQLRLIRSRPETR